MHFQSMPTAHRLPHLSPLPRSPPPPPPPSSSAKTLKPLLSTKALSHGANGAALTPPTSALRSSGAVGRSGLDPFRGKPGFGDLVFGSPRAYLFARGPQFFLGNAIEAFLRDEILAEIITSFLSEIIFYVGLASFLSIADKVQRPYLDFSPKRWSLITGLRGYLSSAFFTMGFKVFAPLLVAYVVWPVVGLPAIIAVAPFLLSCAAQFAFEMQLDRRRSSCWPLLPIIFEVYRVYQLNKGAHFVERLMFSMRGSSITPALMERSSAFVSMLAVLQILGVVCLWSLMTFLIRLFPSRPVAENY
uniref:Uncharacterized protein n=1 Tax=Ananas comosus var. bracteatus TaxID=296719 RepID=A0A6V7NLM9_ANACO|nr:unnamed protein product [Ananas comosus var. bracteatus]